MSYARKSIDELSTRYGGVVRLARRDLGIRAFGCQVFELPPNVGGPRHSESGTGQQELYVNLGGSAESAAGQPAARWWRPSAGVQQSWSTWRAIRYRWIIVRGPNSTRSPSTSIQPRRIRGPRLAAQGAHAVSRGASPSGLGFARAALIVGLLYAAVSVYWGLGGTWLLDTVGGTLERQGRAGNAAVMLAVWAAVALKLIAALLPLIAVRGLTKPTRNRVVWALAWAAAAILTVYGVAHTAVGLLVQAGAISTSATADHRALAWHAYLWDPWFLIWGMLVTAALLRGRHRRSHTTPHGSAE